MSVFKILIVSDLHVGKPEDADNSTRLTVETPDMPISNNPLNSLKHSLKEHDQAVDLLLNLGDVANKGYVAGWNTGIRLLRELANSQNCPMISTPGNHDYCFGFDEGAVDLLKRTLFYPTDNEDANNCFWGRGYCIYTIQDIQFLIINSERLLLSPDDLKKCPDYETFCDKNLPQYLEENKHNGPRIAIVHHHVIQHSDLVGKYSTNDVIEHADGLLNILEANGFCCVIHGHKHLPRFTSYNNMGVLACGSLSCLENIRTSDEDNYYHIMTLDIDQESVRGKVESFHYIPRKGWFPISDPNKDFKRLYGFGSKLDLDAIIETLEKLIGDGHPVVQLYSDEIKDTHPEIQYLSHEDIENLKRIIESKGFKFFQNNQEIIIFKK